VDGRPAGGERRRFASGSISGLCVSVDRSQAAYLRKQDDHRQVFVQPLDGGEATMIADLPLGAAGVRWMPDGRLLALATLWRDHPDLEATRRHEPEPRLEVRATEDAIYRYWDVWLEHVYHPVILDPADGSALDLTPDSTRFWAWPSTNDTIGEIDVSPDGKWITFSADDSEAPHRQLCWSVFVMGAADGAGCAVSTPTETVTAAGPASHPMDPLSSTGTSGNPTSTPAEPSSSATTSTREPRKNSPLNGIVRPTVGRRWERTAGYSPPRIGADPGCGVWTRTPPSRCR
jgi:hypothetical protein